MTQHKGVSEPFGACFDLASHLLYRLAELLLLEVHGDSFSKTAPLPHTHCSLGLRESRHRGTVSKVTFANLARYPKVVLSLPIPKAPGSAFFFLLPIFNLKICCDSLSERGGLTHDE